MGLLKIKALGIEITACESFIDVICLFYVLLIIRRPKSQIPMFSFYIDDQILTDIYDPYRKIQINILY